MSIIYGQKDKDTIQRDFSLSRYEEQKAKKLSEKLLEWDESGVSDEVIVGALTKYLERKNNGPS